MLSFNPFTTTRPVAATGFETTDAYYTRRGVGLCGSKFFLAVWVNCAYR